MVLLSPALVAFQAVVESGTVHGAAKRLGLTQTAVTQRILNLEQELRTTLFLRSRKGMTLTDEGGALLRYCQAAAELEGHTLASLHDPGRERETRLRIQGPSSILRARVIPSLTRAQRKAADSDVGDLSALRNVIFSFTLDDVRPALESLKRGEVDLAIVEASEIPNEFDSKKLVPEEYALVGPPAWKPRPLTELIATERIVDFDPRDKLTFRWLEKFGLRALARENRHYANNTDALVSLVAAGVGYTVLALEFARPFIDSGALAVLSEGQLLQCPMALAWHHRQNLPPPLRQCIKALR